jgi:hypothetical protein
MYNVTQYPINTYLLAASKFQTARYGCIPGDSWVDLPVRALKNQKLGAADLQ